MVSVWVRLLFALVMVSVLSFSGWTQQSETESPTTEQLDGTVRGIITGLNRVTVMIQSPRQVAFYLHSSPEKLPSWVRPGVEVTVRYRKAEDGSYWVEQIEPYKPPMPTTVTVTPVVQLSPSYPTVSQPAQGVVSGQTAPAQLTQPSRQGTATDLRQRMLGSRGLNSALQSRLGQVDPIEAEVQRLLPHYKAAAKFFNPNLTDQQAEVIATAILRSSIRSGIDPRLVVAVIACESSFRPDAIGKKGEIGLGQLKPETAAALGVDPYDPVQNIDGCVRYLRQQWERFGDWELALAAYNAGPTAVSKAGGIPQNEITPRYVRKVLDLYRRLCGQ